MTTYWKNPGYLSTVRDIVLKNKQLVFFDTETTGLHHHDRPFQVSVIVAEAQPDKSLVIKENRTWNFDPGVEMSEGAAEVTGVTTEQLRTFPSIREVLATGEMQEVFSRDCVYAGHNINFDINGMKSLFSDCGETFPEHASICTLEMSRILLPGQSHKLCDVVSALHLTRKVKKMCGGDYHTATFDVAATMAVYEELLPRIASIPEKGNYLPFIVWASVWDGYNHKQRSYLFGTGDGKKIAFNRYKKEWSSKDYDLSKIDMEEFERIAFDKLDALLQAS